MLALPWVRIESKRDTAVFCRGVSPEKVKLGGGGKRGRVLYMGGDFSFGNLVVFLLMICDDLNDWWCFC